MPTLRTMFISSGDVRRKFESRGRKLLAPTRALAHLLLPSGTCAYPESYILAVLRGTHGPLTLAGVLSFNQDRGQELVTTAIEEFQRRVQERTVDERLTIDDVSWLLGVTRRPVDSWCKTRTLPSYKVGDRTYIQPVDLLNYCSWVIQAR